jgi:hypothetical protein
MKTGDANKFSDLDDESVCDIYAKCKAAQKLFRGGTVGLSKREEEAMNAEDLITREMHRRGLTGRIDQVDCESAEIAMMSTLAHAARRTGGSVTLAPVPTSDSRAPQEDFQRTVSLPHGYTVTLKFSAANGLTFDWSPKYPVIEPPREQRFWRKYYDARNAFLQDVADVTGDTIEVAGADGTTIIEPSHHTKH